MDAYTKDSNNNFHLFRNHSAHATLLMMKLIAGGDFITAHRLFSPRTVTYNNIERHLQQHRKCVPNASIRLHFTNQTSNKTQRTTRTHTTHHKKKISHPD